MFTGVNNPKFILHAHNVVMHNHKGTTEKRMTAVAQRLKEAIAASPKYRDYGNKDLAKIFGVTGAAVGHWLNGKRFPSIDTCIDISERLGISLDWLILGQGAMKLPKIKGRAYYVDDWPESAKNVIHGMAVMYDDQQYKNNK